MIRTPAESILDWINRTVSGPIAPDVSLGTLLAGEDLTTDVLRAGPVGNITRITGTTNEQTIKNASGAVLGLLVNTGVDGETVTITDGSNAVAAWKCAGTGSAFIPLAFRCSTNIKLTLANSGIDISVIWV